MSSQRLSCARLVDNGPKRVDHVFTLTRVTVAAGGLRGRRGRGFCYRGVRYHT
ncbi:hypothetical protein J6590_052630 [Homalodisca vitripennis]|nr:hypothetical protein J6590_052630 [Homalodisca vitripennis]